MLIEKQFKRTYKFLALQVGQFFSYDYKIYFLHLI